jgi:DNA-binding GntR family transcriptional regulator
MPPKSPRVPYLAVADALRERIDSGEWLPGEALPSMAQLGKAYSVSRSTIERAVHVLVSEGKLTTVKGWGVFVAER